MDLIEQGAYVPLHGLRLCDTGNMVVADGSDTLDIHVDGRT
jgi:hypothetical protein